METLFKKAGVSLKAYSNALVLLLLVVSTWNGPFFLGFGAAKPPGRPIELQPRGTDWLAQPAFQQIIARHDQFQPEFRRWRQMVSCHAPEIARMLSTLPGSEDWNIPRIEHILSRLEPPSSLDGGQLFVPWFGRWSGKWCNGKWQFHTWGEAQPLEGQWVQPVTLSESEFVALNWAQEMLARGDADIAINVYSPQNGITGWVSKVQHGRMEMPHIGYQLNDTTILWFSQIKHPGQEQYPGQDWLMFLESVSRKQMPARYGIQGLGFRLEETGGLKAASQNHSGLYTAQNLP